ncbi:MAG TPA: UDP-glucose/GDP-mannose dehydrogenase family protein [Thermodesulfobacteriota bacterium]|nr:UDP-glucose/GDP-mannose dehydrogenase family protein [Thermodesulfobacteriota bacterium]
MNICVVGVGYVGLVTGACFAEFGLRVTCVDKDAEKIGALAEGRIPIYEPGLSELVAKNLKTGNLAFTTDLRQAVSRALVVFIAVGTPQGHDGSADLQYIREVARSIGETMDGYKVVVTKSTVPVGTGKVIRRIIEESQAEPVPFDLAANPEFLREGSAIEDFMRPNRVVIGADSQQAIAILKDLYSPLYLIETPFVITDIETAELIKYASNAFLATKISFINEMALLCEAVGADVHVVAKGMGLDQRIGPKFLHPGPGFGGSCFPKDLRALAHLARECGIEFKLVEATMAVNERQRLHAVAKIERALGGGPTALEGKTVALLGLTFKPNTDDLRESPALFVLERLLAGGARVRAFDPAGMPGARRLFPQATYCEDAYEAARGADALVIATEWNQFRNLDWERLKTLLARPVVVDLRNVYEPDRMRRLGFSYHGVGR